MEQWLLCANRCACRRAVPAGLDGTGPEAEALRAQVGQDIYDLNVQQYCCAGLNFGYYYDNSPLIAYDGEPRSPDAGELERLAIHPMAETVARHALHHPLHLPGALPGAILTDDYNPIDVRDLWLKEWVRRNILASTHLDILLR